ncbi:MAG: calcium/sodium antiporter [Burkholderiales bacterium]|nr:calcium/sodium antiporter [Burkholderiales bacterium]
MTTQLLLFAAGLVGLVAGAELLVRGASRLALSFGISPLVVGLTVVAFGTSAPEMTVSVAAVLDGQTGLAIGNVVGSNVFNVLGILGLAALIAPLLVHVQVIRQEVPIMIGASLLVMLLGLDGRIGLVDAAMLALLLVAYTVFLVVQSRAQSASAPAEFAAELPPPATGRWDSHWAVQLLLVVAGLALLVVGSDTMVGAAVSFARALGISETVIGLTIVAVGTSLPEVAASVMAAFKGERDIAVGNVVGSCVFNLLGVLGLAGLAAGSAGLPIPDSVLRLDLWVMLAAAVACLPIFVTGREVARWEGAVFVAYYAAYTAYLILRAQQHEALPAFSGLMMGFVGPLTLVTLVVMLIPRGRSG